MKIELLAPVSDKEKLDAAIDNGADAVYLGIEEFNARRRATNFKLEELKEIVNYTHKKGVKVFVTLNTLIKNSELDRFFKTVSKIYLSGADAVIIQSIPLANIIKENYPDLEVHLSTQSTITNSEYKDIVKADRIVLPRELSLEQVKTFIKNTNIPIEVFIQGALCFSFSGQCLFSSFVSGTRSGNRGLCTQPCRLRYNNKYLLSMKDLSLVYQIPELIKTGISSLKIEGRLRSKEYVALATRLYREAIDSYYSGNFKVNEELLYKLKLEFNRDFTEGYLMKKQDVISKDISKNKGIYLGVINENNELRLESNISIKDGIAIWRKDESDGAIIKKITIKNKEVTKANKGEIVNLNIRTRKGDLIYLTSESKSFKLEALKNKPEIKIKERKEIRLKLPEINKEEIKKQLLVKVYTLKEAEEVAENGADIIFYSIFEKDFPKTWKHNSKLYAYIPRIIYDEDIQEITEKMKNVKGVLLGNLGLIKLFKNKEIFLDYNCNIFNDLDLQFARENNAVPIISTELSLNEISEFKNKNFAVLAHGEVILMNTKYNLEDETLIDDKNYKFKIVKEKNISQLLNSKTLGLFNKTEELMNKGISIFYLDLRKSARRITSMYSKIISGQKLKSKVEKGFTTGHFSREVE